jgi:hypothetical protein
MRKQPRRFAVQDFGGGSRGMASRFRSPPSYTRGARRRTPRSAAATHARWSRSGVVTTKRLNMRVLLNRTG